jgi:hypothetical protein
MASTAVGEGAACARSGVRLKALHQHGCMLVSTMLGARGLPAHAQVFDSGLIGEGVLHLLAWAQARLLTPDAVLVRPARMRQ